VHNDSQSPILDIIDKLTEPTACSLFDGTMINMELALANIPFQKDFNAVSLEDGYVVVQPTYSLCPKKNVILELLGQIIKEVK
jgi:hypothetical protein